MENKEETTLNSKEESKKYSLEELLEQCKPRNRHEEVDFGIEGKELL